MDETKHDRFVEHEKGDIVELKRRAAEAVEILEEVKGAEREEQEYKARINRMQGKPQ